MLQITRTQTDLISLLVFCFCMAAWATPASAQDDKTLFYPPLPDAPRIQYLTSYSVPSDVKEQEQKKSGWLTDFVLGDEQDEDDVGPNKPYGVALKNGRIHVVDTRGSGYAIFDVAGKNYRFRVGSGAANMPKPINIEIDADGTKYVADTGRNQILVFDRDDEFLRAIGKRGQFKPTDVLVHGERLYVIDIYEHRIVVLNKNTGDELFAFGKPSEEYDGLLHPTNMAMGPNEHLYVSDTSNFRVQEFTPDGQFVKTYGAGVGTAPGSFARPKGIAVDREGRVYVVDAAFERVQVFNEEGQLLMYFGEPGATHVSGLDLPTDIDIDYDSVRYFEHFADPDFELEFIIVIANQFGQNKVNVFGFGRHKSMSYDEE